MAAIKKDVKREHRIDMEIIVDAYAPEEQAMGWYYYLEEKLQFPFRAKCVAERRISPLRKGDEVEIVGMNEATETIVDKLAMHDKPGAMDQLMSH